MYDFDKKVARGSAKGLAEETLGLYSHSAGHTELLFELWERGLGPAARATDQLDRIGRGASVQCLPASHRPLEGAHDLRLL